MKHMKKALSVLLTLVMLICLIPAGILAAEGNTATIGNDSYEFTLDADGNYLIQSEADWYALSDAVRANELCQGLTFKQTADLSVNRPIGGWKDNQKKFFCGTYDGGNHTLTVTLKWNDADFRNDNSNYCCPFPYVSGVTIKNLRVEGTVTTQKKFASGLLGQLLDGGTISNVEVAVTINSSVNGDGTHGGVVACIDSKILESDGSGYVREPSNDSHHDLVTNITNVTFSGSLLGNNTCGCGGFVGYAKTVINFKDCAFDPAEVTIKVNHGKYPSYTYARDGGGTETYENCVYTSHLEKTDPTFEGAVEASTTPPTDGSDYVAVVINGVTYYKEASADPEFSGYSLILTGTVGMTFYVHIPDSTEWTKKDSYMTFAISGKGGLVSERANFDDNNAVNPDGTTFYGFTCNVTALQMADKITATYHVMNGSEEVKTISNTYSVEEYIKVIVKNQNNTFGERDIELAKALADYGHYVQLYLSDLRGFTLAADNDSAYAPMNTYYDAFNVNEAKSAVENYAIVKGINDDIQKITYSMFFETDNSICIYVYPKASFEGTVSATVDGYACTATKVNGSKYQIKIPGFNATQFATSHTVVISTGSDDVTVTVSAFSYLRSFFRHFADGSTESNAAAAAYNYYAEASRYANAH